MTIQNAIKALNKIHCMYVCLTVYVMSFYRCIVLNNILQLNEKGKRDIERLEIHLLRVPFFHVQPIHD